MTDTDALAMVRRLVHEFGPGHYHTCPADHKDADPKSCDCFGGHLIREAQQMLDERASNVGIDVSGQRSAIAQNNSSGLVPVSPGIYAPVPDDEPPLGHKEGDIITYVMENGNGRILHVERPTGASRKREMWKALRAFYRWYDIDGSVGGAANVFEDHREAVMAYLHANLPDKDQASPGYTQYTGFRP